MRIALFGSPSFAVPTLESLTKHHEVALVVTQPDKPVGRGMKMQSPPLAQRAKELGLSLEQPKKLKGNEIFHDLLDELNLDLAVTAAYGKLLPQRLLDVPKHGFLNVHASLLPKYRGAAPIQWALIKGEKETGISIMQTEAGLDTGPVRHVKKHHIQKDATATDMFNQLAELGAEAMTEALELLEKDMLPLHPQEDAKATLAPLLTKDDGRIRWHESAQAIYDRYRGVYAWPKTHTLFNGEQLKVHSLSVLKGKANPGAVLELSQEGVVVGAAQDVIRLELVQMPSKSKMSAHDWANGYGVKVGDEFG